MGKNAATSLGPARGHYIAGQRSKKLKPVTTRAYIYINASSIICKLVLPDGELIVSRRNKTVHADIYYIFEFYRAARFANRQ